MELNEAQQLAEELIAWLSPVCERIQIAGSVRRQMPVVGDIELVAIPRFQRDMFGEICPNQIITELDELIERLVWDGTIDEIRKNGSRMKAFRYKGRRVDLFIVRPPAQFGYILALRTGPADFSKKLVTKRKYGGLCPSNFDCKDGGIYSGSTLFETPDEEDFFRILNIEFSLPELRR